jgi:hypothetical protein
VVNARSGRLTPGKEIRYPLNSSLDGCGKPRPTWDFFFVFSCPLYFFRACFFVLTVLYFAFCLYLHHTTQTSMPSAGFESAIPAGKRLLTYALDHAATGIGKKENAEDAIGNRHPDILACSAVSQLTALARTRFEPRTAQPVASRCTDYAITTHVYTLHIPNICRHEHITSSSSGSWLFANGKKMASLTQIRIQLLQIIRFLLGHSEDEDKLWRNSWVPVLFASVQGRRM